MSDRKTDNATLVSALRKLSRDIESGDGIANACVAEAADRIEELATELDDARLEIVDMQCRYD